MSTQEISLNFESTAILIKYDDKGLPHIQTADDKAYAYAQGFLHGKDRCQQLTLLQAIMRSRVSLWFEESEEAIEIDKFMAHLSMYYQARKEESQLYGDDRKYLKSYTEGLNQGRRTHWPKSLKLLKVPMQTWTLADSLALLKLMGYIGLASSQKEAEKFIAQSLNAQVSPEYIASLFKLSFSNEDHDVFEILKKVKFDKTLIPENKFFKAIPSLKNSNNWVLGKSLMKSDSPLMAFDPHLEINRFPAIWYETYLNLGERSVMGITMPGVPGIVMGRNQDVAFSFTYGFMDTIDYFIEEINREEVKEDNDEYSGLIKRKEIIKTKSRKEIELNLFETQRGILEVPPQSLTKMGNLEDGLYLSRAWSGHQQGSAQAIGLLRQIPYAKNVEDACHLVKDLFISCNWLFCDKVGNIAQQQSGYLPERKNGKSGLIPRLASQKESHWQRFHCPEKLHHIMNPECDYLITANHQIPEVDGQHSVNLPMASYRKDRIEQYISAQKKWEMEQMKSLQADICSLQAQQYLDLIREFLPDTPNGRLLKDWDGHFHAQQKAPFLYSKFIENAYQILFSPAFGEQAWDHLTNETAIVADYYGNFDRIILKPGPEDALWFQKYSGEGLIEKRNDFLKKALKKTLARYTKVKLKSWGQANQFHFTHILFGEKLGRTPVLKYLFNPGPYPLRGDKTTVCQGNLFKSNGRVSTFAPSYRMITTMNDPLIFSAIPGGAHESVFRPHWFSETKRYLNLQYKSTQMELL